ncbi:MAG: OadG family protein [Bacteroidales bacterium]|nr:OadG family protein [Bacteroidales bacterium]
MKHIKLILVVAAFLGMTFSAAAQSQNAMRINEYLVINTDDFQDDYGQQNSWIELFNSSYGTVDLSGCFLTDDPANLTKYSIPGGDVLTKIKPRQHVIFWADNQPRRGSFHVNFDLESADEILFVKGDGQTIIDRIKVRHDLPENVSYGRVEDGIGSTDGTGEGWAVLDHTSASTNNATIDKAGKAVKMKEIDPYGWVMAVTAMSVVFSALIILYFLFKLIGIINIRAGKKKEAKVSKVAVEETKYGEVSAETYAAIAMALHLYKKDEESHDEESYVVTLQRTARTYTPWSTHIQGMRQLPEVNKRK